MCCGILISDNKYHKNMEGYNWLQVIKKFAISKRNARLILELQEIHDSNSVFDWKLSLKLLAEKHKLIFNYNQ